MQNSDANLLKIICDYSNIHVQSIFYFLTHEVTVLGRVDSSRYYPSPIHKGGLEILINTEFIISKDKVKILVHLNSIMEKYYKSLLASVGNIEEIDLDEFKKDNNEDDLQVAMANGEKKEDGVLKYMSLSTHTPHPKKDDT